MRAEASIFSHLETQSLGKTTPPIGQLLPFHSGFGGKVAGQLFLKESKEELGGLFLKFKYMQAKHANRNEIFLLLSSDFNFSFCSSNTGATKGVPCLYQHVDTRWQYLAFYQVHSGLHKSITLKYSLISL